VYVYTFVCLGFVKEMCLDADGFLVICRALDVIDDTVLLKKSVRISYMIVVFLFFSV